MLYGLLLVVMAGSSTTLPAQSGGAAGQHPRNQEFSRIFAQWKTMLGQMRKLQEEYSSATNVRKTEIQEQYGKLVRGEANWSRSSSTPPKRPRPKLPE